MNNIVDKQIAQFIEEETQRQQDGISLIASENYASPQVLSALGSILNDKYAEGYPGKRYYSGCGVVDSIEELALERCKNLFQAEYANVQPHSGSQANMAVYFAFLKPGDTIMALQLSSGGHLTHGHSVNFSGKLYNRVSYQLNKQTELIDYEHLELLAQHHKPKLIIAGSSSYSRIIDFKKFHAIAQSVNAYLLVDAAHFIGLIAAGAYPSPAQFADIITATTHKTLQGPRGAFILSHTNFAKQIDQAVFPGIQGGPFMNSVAAKAICFLNASQAPYKAYIKQALLNAQTLVKSLQKQGFRIISDGTDTHLFVVDLTPEKITGKDAEKVLEQAGIFTSRSTIPFDQQKPSITSGIRFGTLALTSRGYTEKEVEQLGNKIGLILRAPHNSSEILKIKEEIRLLNQDFLIPTL